MVCSNIAQYCVRSKPLLPSNSSISLSMTLKIGNVFCRTNFMWVQCTHTIFAVCIPYQLFRIFLEGRFLYFHLVNNMYFIIMICNVVIVNNNNTLRICYRSTHKFEKTSANRCSGLFILKFNAKDKTLSIIIM